MQVIEHLRIDRSGTRPRSSDYPVVPVLRSRELAGGGSSIEVSHARS